MDERSVDHKLADLADSQHGIVTKQQMRSLGLGDGAIYRRVRLLRLRRLHHGVYALGTSRLTQEAFDLAAVLACGPSAYLSGISAARSWQLLPPWLPSRLTAPRTAYVSVVGRRHTRQGIEVRSHSRARPDDLRIVKGIRVASPGLAIVESAGTLSDRALEFALSQVRVRSLATQYELSDLCDRFVRLANVIALRRLVEAGLEPTLTRSEAEEKFLKLVRTSRLQTPRVNAAVGGFEVDFLWDDAKVIVEIDGYRYHGHRAAFESDRSRQTELQAQGFQVVRFTWRQMTFEPEVVMARLTRILRLALSV